MGKVKETLSVARHHVPDLFFKSNPNLYYNRSYVPVVRRQMNNYLCEIQHKNTHIIMSHDNGVTYLTKYSNDRPFLLVSTSSNNQNSSSNDNNNPTNHNGDKEIDTKLLTRKANLGTIVQMLQLKIPYMLTDLLPQDFVSDKIILKILPNQFPNLPTFKGYLMYCSTLKAIQKILLMFYLNPESRIHVSNIKIIEPTNSMSSDELINLSLDNNHLENSHPSNADIESTPNQDTSKYTTKIKVKWRTCYSGCDHLRNSQTTDAKLGSYSIDHFDWTKFLKSPNPLQTLTLLEAKKTIEGLAKTLDPLNNTNNNTSNSGDGKFTGRILTGVFVFELDAENEHVMVFTIDNMEILESKQTGFINGCLA